MAKKVKLSDAAKDLEISSQELINFFAEKGDNKKKASTALTEDDMDLVLEHFTRVHEVKSFDSYFATKTPDRLSPSPRSLSRRRSLFIQRRRSLLKTSRRKRNRLQRLLPRPRRKSRRQRLLPRPRRRSRQQRLLRSRRKRRQ